MFTQCFHNFPSSSTSFDYPTVHKNQKVRSIPNPPLKLSIPMAVCPTDMTTSPTLMLPYVVLPVPIPIKMALCRTASAYALLMSYCQCLYVLLICPTASAYALLMSYCQCLCPFNMSYCQCICLINVLLPVPMPI